jgi:hypothetical protein
MPIKNSKARYTHFVLQKKRIMAAYPSFECTLAREVLTCNAKITPSEGSDTYSIRITYKLKGIPRVKVTHPKIPQELWQKVHIYSNGTLCLYDHRVEAQPWKWQNNLHETIIPWTAEWLVYYELFLVFGKWLGPEAEHGNSTKTQPRSYLT